MSKSQEQYAADFTRLVNDKFSSSDPLLYLDKFDMFEECESSHESLNLVATTALSLCPSDNLKVRAARPKPDETINRPEGWHDYDVYCVTVDEYYDSKSQVQTDFYVKTGLILMRRMVTFPDDSNFLPNETNDEYLYRQMERLVDHTWHLLARPGGFDETALGRPLEVDETEELLQWIQEAEVAQEGL